MLRIHTVGIALLFMACGSSSLENTGADADLQGDASSWDAGPLYCTHASQCSEQQVCDVATMLCTASPSCSTHLDCGAGAFCHEDGICRHGDVGTPCESALQCDVRDGCQFGYCGCDGTQIVADEIPPNIMVLLDRSTSMLFNLYEGELPGGGYNYDDPIRWDTAFPAVQAVAQNYQARANLGLAMYPRFGGVNCEVSSSPLVTLGTNQASAITSAMLANPPTNDFRSTPIRAIFEQVRAGNLFTPAADRGNYLLFVTDGKPTCPDTQVSRNAIIGIVGSLASQNPPIHTFAVGFGGDSDMAFLDQVAVAGGTTAAFSTEDQQSLEDALAEVFTSVLGCNMDITGVGEADEIVVLADDDIVASDPDDGWTRDGDRLIFHGASCNLLQSGTVDDVKVVTGCDFDVE